MILHTILMRQTFQTPSAAKETATSPPSDRIPQLQIDENKIDVWAFSMLKSRIPNPLSLVYIEVGMRSPMQRSKSRQVSNGIMALRQTW